MTNPTHPPLRCPLPRVPPTLALIHSIHLYPPPPSLLPLPLYLPANITVHPCLAPILLMHACHIHCPMNYVHRSIALCIYIDIDPAPRRAGLLCSKHPAWTDSSSELQMGMQFDLRLHRRLYCNNILTCAVSDRLARWQPLLVCVTACESMYDRKEPTVTPASQF